MVVDDAADGDIAVGLSCYGVSALKGCKLWRQVMAGGQLGWFPSTAVTPQLMIAVLGTGGLFGDGDTTASDTPGVIEISGAAHGISELAAAQPE